MVGTTRYDDKIESKFEQAKNHYRLGLAILNERKEEF